MALALKRLDVPSRSDGVFDQLKHQILTGAIAPGGRLPNERDLAAHLGVNRSSVREAVRRLESLELVTVLHGQGTFVREASDSAALQIVEALLREPRAITVDLLRQTLLFRRDVTLRVVELAALNRTEAHVARARALLGDEEREGASPERALTLDVEMNRLLGEATGNLMYQVVTNLFTKLIRQLGPLYYNARRDHRRSLDTHERLLAAMEARDAAEARRILETMLDYSEGSILGEAERLEREGVIGPGAPDDRP